VLTGRVTALSGGDANLIGSSELGLSDVLLTRCNLYMFV
jgi:hypothetical protein